MSDELLELYGKYFVKHEIREKYGITFAEFFENPSKYMLKIEGDD